MTASNRPAQEWKGSERGFVPSSCFTLEDGQREVRKVGEPVVPGWANNFQSSMENMESAFKSMQQRISSLENMESDFKSMQRRISSLENDLQKLKDKVELANNHSPHLGRANARSMGENDERNLRLQIQTKVSDPLFTGSKLEGERGAPISVALIDANTRDIVRSGPESSIKLEVVVLNGDFNKDDEDNWAQEDFDNHMVKIRQQKGLLLTGDLQLTLKEGVGELGDLIFMDNSSWDRIKKFRIGLKVASGYCENTRIREGKTNAFRVKEHRGESSKKHHPPQSKDEVWRLEKIAKDGKSHQKLKEAGIDKVKDFLQQLHMDSQRLREVLGKSITLKNWDCLIAHAKTCPDWKPSSDNPVGMGEHAAVFNNDHQLTSLIDDKYLATHRLSSQEKEPGDTIVKKAAFYNCNVGEFTGETYSGSMRKNSSQVSEGQIGNLVPVHCYLAPPTCATPVGLEVPRANAGSTVEGHYNDVTAWPSQVQSHKTNCGDASTSGVQWSGTLPRSEGDDVMGYLRLDDADDLEKLLDPTKMITRPFRSHHRVDGFLRGTENCVNFQYEGSDEVGFLPQEERRPNLCGHMDCQSKSGLSV